MLRSLILWTLFSVIVVLVLFTGVHAQESTEVNAGVILEQIKKGENIDLDNIRITGELNLSEIKLNKTTNISRSHWQKCYFALKEKLNVVESTITIKNSVFENDVDFSNTQFEKDVDFYNSSFLGSSYFNGTVFKSYLANFNYVNFGGDACFYGADFSGEANFDHVTFSGDSCFYDASFSGPHVDFRNAHFRRKANFMGASSTKKAAFNNANFSDTTIFNFNEFNKVLFRDTTFTNVSFNGTDFNRMEISWSDLKDNLIFNGPAYIKLIKKFREMEQFEDADAAYYQYRRLSQANKEWSFSKLMDVVAWLSCGYGVKPGYPLIWALALIVVFALIYKQGNGIKRLKLKENGDSRVSFWDAFYFSLVTFTTVGYGDWYPEDRYRKFVMMEGVLGWLLLALFIVTLANVMIRP